MAEYITKEQVLETECEKCPVYDCLFHCPTYNALNNIPTADVIERSKINKAIEEISNLHGEYFAVMDKDYKTTHKRFLDPKEVLKILDKYKAESEANL